MTSPSRRLAIETNEAAYGWITGVHVQWGFANEMMENIGNISNDGSPSLSDREASTSGTSSASGVGSAGIERVQTPSSEQVEPGFASAWKWVLPLVLYMLVPTVLSMLGVTSISDKVYDGPRPEISDTGWMWIVIAQVSIVAVVLLLNFRDYLTALPFGVSAWTLPLGIVGLLAWVGICGLELENQLAELIPTLKAYMPPRPSINPSQSFPDPTCFLIFLCFRFAGLVVVVPIAEELFLRGYLLRMLQQYAWWELPMKSLLIQAVLYSSIYGLLTHPTDAVAAIIWFAGVTIWVRWSNRFWDGVVIHAITNLCLGLYVMQYQQWHLW